MSCPCYKKVDYIFILGKIGGGPILKSKRLHLAIQLPGHLVSTGCIKHGLQYPLFPISRPPNLFKIVITCMGELISLYQVKLLKNPMKLQQSGFS